MRAPLRPLRLLVPVVILCACQPERDPGTRDLAGAMADGGTPDGNTAPDLSAPTTYTDFPAAPILDPAGTAPPADVATLFGAPTSGTTTGGPCLVDPELGALFPGNWLRLRVHFTPAAGQNVFELRVHADNQLNDLVVYTTATTWTMPLPMWTALSSHVVDQPITITIRGGTLTGGTLSSGPALGSKGTIKIAPATAPGAIVYWTSSNGTALKGFSIGDETVHDVLRPSQVGTGCVGCHTSTPDGQFVGFAAASDPAGGNPASIALRSVDGALTTPSFLTASAQALLARQSQQQPVFSKAHWTTGDRVAISTYLVSGSWQVMWTDLEASAQTVGVGYGLFARTGDANMAAAPAFSHDGNTVVYTSAASVDGVNTPIGGGDLRAIPYAARAGGPSTAVAGASDAAFNENYASFSPDDQLLAFSRVPTAESSVNNPKSEVLLVPKAGGTATRIVANDPPACSGKSSPGVTNSWAKWAPSVTVVGPKTYYWLTFSSTRGAGGNPQLYVAGAIAEGGVLTTFPALYLWNQPASENNHTPSWDVFQLPVL